MKFPRKKKSRLTFAEQIKSINASYYQPQPNFSSLKVFLLFFPAPRIKTTLTTPPKIDKCRVAQTNIPGVSDGRVSTPSLDHFANSVSQKAQVALGSSLEATGPVQQIRVVTNQNYLLILPRHFYIMPFFVYNLSLPGPNSQNPPTSPS